MHVGAPAIVFGLEVVLRVQSLTPPLDLDLFSEASVVAEVLSWEGRIPW